MNWISNYSSPVLVLFKEITKEELNEPEEGSHDVNQYVDDSTNVIGAPSLQIMKKYIEKYMVLLERFYAINKLKINAEKTKIMVMKTKNTKKNLEISLKNGEIITRFLDGGLHHQTI